MFKPFRIKSRFGWLSDETAQASPHASKFAQALRERRLRPTIQASI